MQFRRWFIYAGWRIFIYWDHNRLCGRGIQTGHHGPSSEDKDKALAFRKFLGDKATLRWFRDGKIAEVAVWEHEEWEKHLIIKDITEHVLQRHLSLPKQNILSIVDQLDFALHHGNRDLISFSKNLLKAYDDLSKQLRPLDEIPLRISSVQPLGSAFRLTSVFPVFPHPFAHKEGIRVKLEKEYTTCIQSLVVLIQLEGSGNWPMDEQAQEKTKSAFLLKIVDSLRDKFGISFTATEDDVDVFMCGYAFRLKLMLENERGLSLVNRKSVAQKKWVMSSDKSLFLLSQHSSMVNGLRGRFPIYGQVVRLAKSWISAHLFSNALTEETIELLVAYLFLKPLLFRPPCSRITGFLRKEDSQNDGPAMFVATAYDKASEAWTSQRPTAAELRRLAAYTDSSSKLLTRIIMQNQMDPYQWQCLFRTPMSNYNAVILLHMDKMPYPRHLLFPSEVKQGWHLISGRASKNFQLL